MTRKNALNSYSYNKWTYHKTWQNSIWVHMHKTIRVTIHIINGQTIEQGINAWTNHTIISQIVIVNFTEEDISLICHKYKVLNNQLGLGASKFFKAFISLTPWLGCFCIVEHKTMGPSFKVDTQSTKVPTTFKYFIMHCKLFFIIPHSPFYRFNFLNIFSTKT